MSRAIAPSSRSSAYAASSLAPEGGSLSEPRPQGAADSNSHPSQAQWRQRENEHYRRRAAGIAGIRDRFGRRQGRHVRDGQAREAGRWRRRRPLRRHHGSRDRPGSDGGARRRRLLPAHDRCRGAHVRRGQDPRRLLQAGGAPHRAGDLDRAHDRPPDPAALAEGLPQRGAVHRDRALGGHGDLARHPGDQRRLGRAADLADAVPRPDRRRSHRADRRRAGREPDASGGARGWRARPDRGRHQGGPDDGRGGRRPGARGDAPRGARHRAARDREALRGAGAAPRESRQAEVARSRRHRGAHWTLRRRNRRPPPSARPAGGRRGRGGHPPARGRHALDGLDRGERRPRAPGADVAGPDPREEALGRGRGAGARAVRGRPTRAHRGRAGLEGAEVGEAATSSTTGSSRRSCCRSRAAPTTATRRQRTRSRRAT